MATWKDGPEYAPTYRPEGFATPEAEPLDVAPPVERSTPGAVPPPAHFQDVEATPLTQIANEPAPTRSPREPFDVMTATMTSVAASPDGTRDPRTAFNVAASTMTAPSQLPPPPPPDAQPIGHGPTPPPAPQAAPPERADAQPPVQRQTYHPARQWQPETHQWRPAPQQQESSEAQSRPLVHLVTGMAFTGMLLPAAAPVLLTIAGIIASGRIPRLREIGYFTSALGGIFLLAQFFLSEPGLQSIYSLAAFGALVAFLIRGYVQRPR